MTDATVFAEKMDAWRRNQDQPWNRLRYLLAEENLLRHIGAGPLVVLDVGGGDGRDAIALAAHGHQVTILDYVPEMLAESTRRAAEAGVAERVRVRQVDVAAGQLPVHPGTVDLVLCHNVLQYVAEPAVLLRAMADVLRPGSWLSLLVPNPASEALRLALREHDLPAAIDSLDATVYKNVLFGAEVRMTGLPELFEQIEASDMIPVAYYGVRCVNDYIGDDAVKFSAEGFGQLQALERAMGERSPYRDIARLWQVLCMRNARG